MFFYVYGRLWAFTKPHPFFGENENVCCGGDAEKRPAIKLNWKLKRRLEEEDQEGKILIAHLKQERG